MLHAIVLCGWLATCVQGFALGPLRWGGLPTGKFVLAPKELPNSASFLNTAASSPQPLIIRERLGTVSSDEIPSFTQKTDQTIRWVGTDLCLEAIGRQNGDAVRVNRCTGESNQLWNLMPQGRHKQIRLQGSPLCVDVNDEDGLDAAVVELRECDNSKMAESWEFETVPLPAQNTAQSPPVSFSHLLVVLVSMASLGVLSLGAQRWQHKKAVRALSRLKGGASFIPDEGGVSMCEPLAVRQSQMLSGLDGGMNEPGFVPAAMALGPMSFQATEAGSLLKAVRKDIKVKVPPIVFDSNPSSDSPLPAAMTLDPVHVKPDGLDGDMNEPGIVPAAMALGPWEPLCAPLEETNKGLKSPNFESGFFSKLLRPSSLLYRDQCGSQCSTMDTIGDLTVYE